MTRQYQRTSKPEILLLRRRYTLALPTTLIGSMVLYFGAASMINAGYLPEGTSAMCVSAAALTLAIKLGQHLLLLWLELIERSMP